jgi:hypothetical protein
MKKKERESGLGFVQKEKNERGGIRRRKKKREKKEKRREGEEWVKYLASNFTKMPPYLASNFTKMPPII